MPVRSSVAAGVALAVLTAVLAGCVGAPHETPPVEEQGPLPPTDALITLQQLATVVTAADAPANSLFDVGQASTSGADLLSEQDYWLAVGGRPEECRDVVSSPYLVSTADAASEARLDDDTGTLGTYSEDEDLFGLVQVYGRVFDDEATASGFLDGFAQTVAGCAAYQFIGDEGTPTYDAVGLHVEESTTSPLGTRVLEYVEDVAGSDILGVSTTFVRRRNTVVAIYSELYPSSAMTPDDVAKLTDTIAARMAAL